MVQLWTSWLITEYVLEGQGTIQEMYRLKKEEKENNCVLSISETKALSINNQGTSTVSYPTTISIFHTHLCITYISELHYVAAGKVN